MKPERRSANAPGRISRGMMALPDTMRNFCRPQSLGVEIMIPPGCSLASVPTHHFKVQSRRRDWMLNVGLMFPNQCFNATAFVIFVARASRPWPWYSTAIGGIPSIQQERSVLRFGRKAGCARIEIGRVQRSRRGHTPHGRDARATKSEFPRGKFEAPNWTHEPNLDGRTASQPHEPAFFPPQAPG